MILRKIRIIISSIVILVFIAAFLFGDADYQYLPQLAGYTQFIPSLMRIFLIFGGITSVGFLVILLLTLIFGRVYCAAFCPLGILQDFFIFLRKRYLRQFFKIPRRLPDFNLLRYSTLALFLLTIAAGSTTLLNLLDPYSFFGRIVTQLIKPVYVFIRNRLVISFEFFDFYILEMKTYDAFVLLTFGVVFVSFVLLMLLTLAANRVFCNSFCPVGTLLGLLSRKAKFQFQIDQEECTACGVCARTCRTGCIDFRQKSIDPSRCVVCFDCLPVCPETGITYGRVKTPGDIKAVDYPRRKLVTGGAALIGSIIIGCSFRSPEKFILDYPDMKGIPPPGSLNFEHFTDMCSACHLCVSNCPTHVLKPAYLEYGLNGVMQPAMSYEKGYCSYECNLCTQICPTGAIIPLTLAEKKLVQMGKVVFKPEYCVVHVKQKDCGACGEVCPTHAVYMVREGKLNFPKTNQDLCTGCGGCEHVCPTTPKSIIVIPNRVHQQAKKPFSVPVESTQPAVKLNQDDEFPF